MKSLNIKNVLFYYFYEILLISILTLLLFFTYKSTFTTSHIEKCDTVTGFCSEDLSKSKVDKISVAE